MSHESIGTEGGAAWFPSWLRPEQGAWAGGNRHDLREHTRPQEIGPLLGQLLVHTKCDLARSKRMLDRLGWSVAGARVQPSSSIQKRHGDFGEAVTIAILENLHRVRVPVIKLRYQIDKEQTLPGTDIVGFALHENSNRIDHLEFVEVKVRISQDLKVAAKAHDQLFNDRNQNFVETLDFLHQRISDSNPDLLEPFEEYLADSREGTLGAYRISLVIDQDLWSEKIVEHLPEAPDLLQPISLDISYINELRSLIADAWASINSDMIDPDIVNPTAERPD